MELFAHVAGKNQCFECGICAFRVAEYCPVKTKRTSSVPPLLARRGRRDSGSVLLVSIMVFGILAQGADDGGSGGGRGVGQNERRRRVRPGGQRFRRAFIWTTPSRI